MSAVTFNEESSVSLVLSPTRSITIVNSHDEHLALLRFVNLDIKPEDGQSIEIPLDKQTLATLGYMIAQFNDVFPARGHNAQQN